jgi:hypothetical protein
MSDFEEIVAANPLAQRALRRDHRPELQAGQHRLDGDAFEQFPDAPVIRAANDRAFSRRVPNRADQLPVSVRLSPFPCRIIISRFFHVNIDAIFVAQTPKSQAIILLLAFH